MFAARIGSMLDRTRVGRWFRASDRRMVVLGALAIRAVAFAGLSIFLVLTERAYLFPDEQQYLRHAAAAEQGGTSPYGYANLLGALFKLAGTSAWLPRAINVLAGALVVLVVYEIALSLVERRQARVAAVVVALWPSMVLWSVTVLRDSILALAIATCFWGVCLVSRGNLWGSIPAIAGAIIVHEWRLYAYVLLGVAIVIGGLAHAARYRKGLASISVLIVSFAMIGWVGGSGPFGYKLIEYEDSVDAVSYVRTEGSSDASTGFATPDTNSVDDVIAGIPKGFANTMFGPFPWQLGWVAGTLLLVELIPWYLLVVAAVAGVWRLGRRTLSVGWASMVVFALGAVVIFSVFGANSGTALRQRAMLIGPFVVMAAVLLDRRPAFTND